MVRDFLTAPRGRAAPLLALLMAGAAWPALAQPQPATSPSPEPKTPSTSAPMTDEDETDDTVAAVVVMGTRDQPQPGAVVGDIQPEIQLGPGEIQSYGVSSITDLLDELAPQLGSNRGRGGERPVVLLNGRRISSFREIREIPTEAILRVDILPEEAALAYGYSADQKVINFVLRRRFHAITAEASTGGPTEGGQVTGAAELNHIVIRGDNRLNVVLKADVASALTEDERGLNSATAAARPYDLVGNITGLGGGEIDPTLSALAGAPVTVAGLPASAAGGQALALSDLAATAGVANTSDVARYRTLKPQTQDVDGNLVFARVLPRDFRGTLTAGFTASHSEALRGLPGASLTIDAGNAFSPFSQDVALNRYVDAFGPLKQTNDSWSGELGGALNRDAGKWRFSLTGDYEHDDSLTHSDVGVDLSGLQAAVDAGGVSPFAAWPDDLIAKAGRNKAQSISDSFNVQGVASGEAFQGPAGPIRTSFKVGEAGSWLTSRSLRSGVETGADLSRNTLSAQGSLDVPIASRRHDFLPFLGELSLNANAAVNDLSDFGAQTTIGFGANWRPVTGVSLIVSHTTDEGAPTMAQLGGPLVTTEAVRIFDYSTGQTVEVRQLSGGNPDLVSDKRNVTKIGLTLKPFSSQDFTIVANYVRSRDDNPIATFPAATAEIEAAFPDRFLRDADGELTQVDYRPVNFARSSNDSLRWGFNYSRPFGPQPQRRFRRPPATDAGEGGPPPDAQPQRPADGARASSDRAQGDGPRPDDGGPPPGGPPGGGPPGGGRGFGPGAGGRLQFAIYHTVTFKDQILVRDGGPVFDLLHGSAAGDGGGQPRHAVEAQAGISRNGLGARLSAKWQSPTTVDASAASATGDLHFSSLATVDLRLFANLGANRDLVQKYPWMRGSRVTLSVTNLFDERQQVRDASGLTPVGYRPDELDPLGRVVKVSLRKLFF